MRYIHKLTNKGVIQFKRIIVSDEQRVVYGVSNNDVMYVTPLQVNGTFSYKMDDWSPIPGKFQ